MTSTIQEYRERVFELDRIRQLCDIRNKEVKELTRYQQMQLRDIKKYTYQLQMVELRKAIFETFDFSPENNEIE